VIVMIRGEHRTATLPLVVVACGLSMCPSPVWSEELPPNVIDHDLGHPGSSFSIRLVDVPYYAGDSVVVEATVRNTEARARSLPEPSGLFSNMDQAPDVTSPPGFSGFSTGIGSVQHSCPEMMSFASAWCLKHLQKNSVRLGPGETRWRRWVSPIIGRYKHRLGDRSPTVFGIRFSSHGVLPDRWFRFAVHRLQDPIRGQLLQDPVHKYRSFFFTAPAGPRRFVVLSTGAWAPHHEAPQSFDAATLNNRAESWSMSQRAIVGHPDPSLAYDGDGKLLVNGQRVVEPDYRFQDGSLFGGGWTLRAGEKPDKDDSNQSPVTETGW
jgi:hypothetical protein